MTKRERVMAALRGDDLDRPPIGFWGHDFLREWTPEGLTAAMVESVRVYDYDYLKINPRASYFVESWGCKFASPTESDGPPAMTSWLLNEPDDLKKIEPIAGDVGAFGEHLRSLRMIDDALGGEVPLTQTVFSPLSVLGRMAAERKLVRGWLDEAPDLVHGALDAITEALSAYTTFVLNAGADGIFFPTTAWGTYDALTDELYGEFGRPYDLRVLEAAKGAEFNVFHVCRANNMLEKVIDYPTAVDNWDVFAEGNASLGGGKGMTDKAIMGGVDSFGTLRKGTPEEVRDQVRAAVDETGSRGFLVGPSCSIFPDSPPENIRAAVDAAKAHAR